MILMTQIYFHPGMYPPDDYRFDNFNVLVRSEAECKAMGESVLITILENLPDETRVRIRQVRFSCTDAIQELEFWPIPDRIPIPKRRI